MQEYRNITNENQINYNVIKLIKEHAKKYQYASDKKEFLKNVVSAYEQKLILLDAINPYEVLCYLEQLDLKRSKVVLDELTPIEINEIISRFSAEDKKRFYEKFSNLELVNQFIKYDKNAEYHVDDLTFERKVDLLDSSSEETVLASSKIYETMTSQEQTLAEAEISTTDGIVALHESDSYEEKIIESKADNKNEQREVEENSINKDNINKVELQLEVIKEEKINIEEEKNKEQKKEEQQEKNSLDNLEEKNSAIENRENTGDIVSNPDIVEAFNKAEKEAEKQEIDKIRNQLSIKVNESKNTVIGQNEYVTENFSKTL